VSESGAIERIATRCAAGGLDLAAVAPVGAYNAVVPVDVQLPGQPDRAVVVIGNTAALWPALDRFVLASTEPLDDPVDTYVEHIIGRAVVDIDEVVDVRYSHEPPPRLVAIQRLADVAGLAWLSPSHLCVHPVFGPWIALRAAIVLDLPAPATPAQPDPPCDCTTGCQPLLDAALAAGQATSAGVVEHWRRWVAVRDACPVGRSHRYTDEQIAYHYAGVRPARWG
jgi:methylmalonic aciduria homocystinuria type C protein